MKMRWNGSIYFSRFWTTWVLYFELRPGLSRRIWGCWALISQSLVQFFLPRPCNYFWISQIARLEYFFYFAGHINVPNIVHKPYWALEKTGPRLYQGSRLIYYEPKAGPGPLGPNMACSSSVMVISSTLWQVSAAGSAMGKYTPI